MKVLIDGRSLSCRATGIASFLLNALKYLSVINSSWTFIIISNKEYDSNLLKKFEKFENIRFLVYPCSFTPNLGFFWFVFKLPFIIKQINPDYYWSPSVLFPYFMPQSVKIISTIHDVVIEEFKNTMSLKNKIVSTLFTKRSINKADYLWAVSNYTANQIRYYYPNRKSQNIFVGSSIDNSIYKKMDFDKGDILLFRNKLSLKSEKKSIIICGYFRTSKELEVFIELNANALWSMPTCCCRRKRLGRYCNF